MVANLETMSLNATQQTDVVKLFNSIQQVHDNMSMAAGQITTLGKTLQLNQFTFIMQHAVHPLIQIKLPTHLCSSADIKFKKEHLMAEKSFEKECSNKVLPQPFHPRLDNVPGKHATHCVAVAVHMLLCKHFFNIKMSQAKCTDLFTIHPKKLHMAVLGQKHDPGKKVSKCKSMEPLLATQKKQDKTNTEKAEMTGPTKEADAATMTPDDEISELDTDDSLPDPFTPKEQPKMLGTKEDQGVENIQEPQEMDTMPELISDENGDVPLKTFISKNPTSIPKTSHHQPKMFTTKNPPPHKPCNK